MAVDTVCLGWHWAPYRYTRTADDVNGHQALPFRLGTRQDKDQTVERVTGLD